MPGMDTRGEVMFLGPRSTEYLRNVSLTMLPDDPAIVNLPFRPWRTLRDHKIGLAEHRKSRIARSLKKKRHWESVRDYFQRTAHFSNHRGVNDDCEKIFALAREVSALSELPTGAEGRVDETAFLLFHLYIEDAGGSTSTAPSKKFLSSLKEYYGNIDMKLASRIIHLYSSLLHWLNPEEQIILKKKLNLWRNGKSSSDEDDDDTKLFPFGRIKLKKLDPAAVGIEDDQIDFEQLISIHVAPSNKKEQTEDEKVMALFSLDSEEILNPILTAVAEKPAAAAPVVKLQWDRTHLLNLVGNQDMLDALVNIISSEKSNDEIQEQLFDLLGFEKLELITKLLENRVAIMKNLNKEEALAMAVRNQVTSASSSQNHPVIGVKIQSAQEKFLEKMYRKEEKKVMKTGGQFPNTSASAAVHQAEMSTGTAMRDTSLDQCPTRGKNKKKYHAESIKKQLEEMAAVIQRSYAASEQQGVDLPNVYDDYLIARQKAGFISGVKLALPENMTRHQTLDYEEINIPLEGKTVPARAMVKELIKISSLDEMAQEVFRGMATLNRIQTLVYETAYRTNENLLICAPTGAGKTNIALLAILNCIQNNIEGGNIRKDQFKIVYVAPMKALAAEMTANFSKRLAPLGVAVRELTGDMQLTKAEITQTQVLVTTPEKWDVVTRKSTGDVALAQIVQLLIIDEVHLLHGDRGPVVESLVARTLRQVESSQRMIRIVGLSATLPNYRDVAQFLRVNPRVGLFYFDSRFRPVPLSQTFIGVKAIGIMDQQRQMDQCCYDKVFKMVAQGHQVMVFVHARNATIKTAEILIEIASKQNQLDQFQFKGNEESRSDYGKALKSLERSRNKKLGELFQSGFSVHHAGLLRSDRTLIEKLFGDGFVRVLVCTATLAWGVNLPAHAVIIKGTEIYDSKQGTFVDLGILDVLQIFGRAGRPQFDKEGHGTIITTHEKLTHYLQLLTNQFPIESNFIKFLADNLNAEIALGSVSNIEEAVTWLTYTYLYIRMRRNPQMYGMQYLEAQDDPLLTIRRKELIVAAAKSLEKAKMIRFDERTEYLYSTDLGRTASHFYIKYDTVETFNEIIHPVMAMDSILMMITKASEFEQLKVRDEELDELDELTRENCWLKVWGGAEHIHGKVGILIQTYISRGFIKSFSLMSDQQYVIQNAIRICRGFFEVVLRQSNPLLTARLLEFSKMLDQQLWDNAHPLRQYKIISPEIMEKLEKKKLSVEHLREMSGDEIGALINHQKMGSTVKRCAEEFPLLDAQVCIQPITRNVLRVRIIINPDFKWNDRLHGNVSESFWIWVEDPDNNYMYHHEYFIMTKRQVIRQEQQELVFTIPITEPLPAQYYVRIVSDRFLGASQTFPVSFKHLILPEQHPPHTDLLDLDPLPVSALKDTRFELLYPFHFFNPIQTQIFHCLFHTDSNALIGAPTGSGKTIAAEMAMFRVFKKYPQTKVVYIAPMKALVRERIIDWKVRLEQKLGKRVVELTGDVTPDVRAITNADVIVTTPEKWDGISRSWQTRSYVQAVSLIIIDEIHLLGEDRGPVLEVIVSRTNFISQHTQRKLRIVGLSTALANARDLANWLGIKGFEGLFNFRPSVRPVPIQVHIQGFPGKHYCPRMATMNKPSYQAIREHSPSKPTLIFVSSRRQTRLTALDLIAYLAAEGNPKQWLHIGEAEMDQVISSVKEPNLKLILSFGIGIHHAGLQEQDRRTVEELFVNEKIQVLIATATLAWGVNFPAHLVVIKGTEFFDGKTNRYVDMPITDVLQMMGRAGRPQFDTSGVAVVLVHDQKKNFYKKFLYEPFPVESSLVDVLPDHLNAEIVAGTISSNQEALDYLTCTYFFRRLVQNPTYYHLDSSDTKDVNAFLSNLITSAFRVLEMASCIYIHDDLRSVEPTSFGRIAGYYYLSHQTMHHFRNNLTPSLTVEELLTVMTGVQEYAQLPVRHNEDNLNEELAKICPIEVPAGTYNSPHTKAHLLLQCHFSRIHLPSSDYYTDLKSVLDQALRILQAMIDACAENGWLASTLNCINLIQLVVQARWLMDDAFLTLPFMDEMGVLALIKKFKVDTLPELQEKTVNDTLPLESCLLPLLDQPGQLEMIYKVLQQMPIVSVAFQVQIDERKIDIPYTRGAKKIWVDLPAGKTLTLIVHLQRENQFPRDGKVYAPKFTKAKDEAWFLILGDTEHRDMLALKRTSGLRRKMQQQLEFRTADVPARVIYTLYLMCDAYLGLDQQYDLCFNVTKNNTACNIVDNTKMLPPPGFGLNASKEN